MEKDFLTNVNFENCSVGSEMKLPHMHWPPTQTLLGLVTRSFPTFVGKERATSPKSICVGGYTCTEGVKCPLRPTLYAFFTESDDGIVVTEI